MNFVVARTIVVPSFRFYPPSVILLFIADYETMKTFSPIGTGDSEDRPMIVVTYSSSLIDQLYRQLLSRAVSSFLLSIRR